MEVTAPRGPLPRANLSQYFGDDDDSTAITIEPPVIPQIVIATATVLGVTVLVSVLDWLGAGNALLRRLPGRAELGNLPATAGRRSIMIMIVRGPGPTPGCCAS